MRKGVRNLFLDKKMIRKGVRNLFLSAGRKKIKVPGTFIFSAFIFSASAPLVGLPCSFGGFHTRFLTHFGVGLLIRANSFSLFGRVATRCGWLAGWSDI